MKLILKYSLDFFFFFADLETRTKMKKNIYLEHFNVFTSYTVTV